MFNRRFLLVGYLTVSTIARCYEPNPAFNVPQWQDGASPLSPALEKLETELKSIINQSKHDNSSYSIEVTSADKILWGNYHTAKNLNKTRPGDTSVDGHSLYRIASNTKVFTVLAILYQVDAGNVSLDAPVLDYIKELKSDKYELPWKDTTIRSLATQLSGIPREFAQSDLYNWMPDAYELGLPRVPEKDVRMTCDEYSHFQRACTRKDLLDELKYFQPLYAPNQKSTYSNLNYELLGLVLENVTAMAYADYIQTAIFSPLNMSSSSFSKPSSDSHAVLPLGDNYWDIEEGIQNPTGGIYSSSSDISKFLRYVLSHYNTLATGVNWFLPGSWAEGVNSFYGMPWEIFRTDKILKHSMRPVTFVTKGGGLPGYQTKMMVLEDYGLGITIFTAGFSTLLNELIEAVTVAVTNAAEDAIWSSMKNTHTGTFTSSDSSLNSSITIEASAEQGLFITSFISNSTDVFKTVLPQFPTYNPDPNRPWHLQLVPTKLFEDEDNQQGEIWRALIVSDRILHKGMPIWDDFCVTDVDSMTYGSIPLNKVVFWREKGEVELSAFRVTLRKQEEGMYDDARFVVQA